MRSGQVRTWQERLNLHIVPYIRLPLHIGEEPISATFHRFDESRTRSRVAEDGSQLIYRGVQAVIEINECVSRPESGTQVLAADDASWLSNQSGQKRERLLLQSQLLSLFAQFPRFQIHF